MLDSAVIHCTTLCGRVPGRAGHAEHALHAGPALVRESLCSVLFPTQLDSLSITYAKEMIRGLDIFQL